MTCDRPDDLSVLLAYDAVVVDGLGIGNGRFENGLDLLMQYEKLEGQSVVYHSGLGASESDRMSLLEKGVSCVTKGSDPEKLANAIRIPIMAKKENKQDEARTGNSQRIPCAKDIRGKMAKRRSMRKKRFRLAAH